MKKKNKSNHELDLSLIKKYGYLSNSEVKLADKTFLTNEKIEVYGNFASNLLKTADPLKTKIEDNS